MSPIGGKLDMPVMNLSKAGKDTQSPKSCLPIQNFKKIMIIT